MTRELLERRQAWVYLAAVGLGLLLALVVPSAVRPLEALLWPVLALLLFATFVQVPLVSIAAAFRDVRFLAAMLVGDFVVLPLLVWALTALVPMEPAVRLGLLLVLLVPCTDWFISFMQLGGGDPARATAVTPVNLLLQLVLLPLYLWLMAGADAGTVFAPQTVWPALLVVLLPLAAAAASERWFRRGPRRERVRERLAWWPVPLLAVVLFLVAAAHAGTVGEALHVLPLVAAAAAVFLVVALALAKLLGAALRLPVEQGRTLAFGFGTRNSFIVLPFALALPAGYELAAITVVMQSLVELLGMVLCLWLVPRVLFPETQESAAG